MEEKEYKYVTLSNNEEYLVLKKIKTNNNEFIYLTNLKDVKDFLIQKIVYKDNEEYIVNLDSDEEFDEALELFNK